MGVIVIGQGCPALQPEITCTCQIGRFFICATVLPNQSVFPLPDEAFASSEKYIPLAMESKHSFFRNFTHDRKSVNLSQLAPKNFKNNKII